VAEVSDEDRKDYIAAVAFLDKRSPAHQRIVAAGKFRLLVMQDAPGELSCVVQVVLNSLSRESAKPGGKIRDDVREGAELAIIRFRDFPPRVRHGGQ
jgi:hypothetical protein